jgi:hypothetical protein
MFLTDLLTKKKMFLRTHQKWKENESQKTMSAKWRLQNDAKLDIKDCRFVDVGYLRSRFVFPEWIRPEALSK